MKVIFVDDDPDMREIVGLSLGLHEGLCVRIQENAQAAISCAVEWCPDVLLTDLNMPDMDGAALMGVLRADPRTEKIPVVILTARSDPVTRDELMMLGAMAILEKPFNPRTLASDLVHLMSDT